MTESERISKWFRLRRMGNTMTYDILTGNEQYDPNQYKPDAGENPLSVLSETDARTMAVSFLNLLERTGEC